MYTVEQRGLVREALVGFAEEDDDIAGAAFVGSSATDQQDAWSDIDLVLQLAPSATEQVVVERWTEYMYAQHAVAHHMDVFAGNNVRYRVFLTTNSLQIDISFWPYDQFRATGDRFQLLFGEPGPATAPTTTNVDSVIGETWLFAIHVRSALARHQPWYALSLLDRMRDRIMILASIRHDLNPHQRREVDQLPVEVLERLDMCRVQRVELDEISRATGALIDLFLEEIAAHDTDLADRLQVPLSRMVSPSF